jgi:RNA polymerase sigma-70 factor, ECF subfamily
MAARDKGLPEPKANADGHRGQAPPGPGDRRVDPGDAAAAVPSLAAIFVATLPDAVRGAAPPPGELEEVLRRALHDARRCWPGLDVPTEAFVAHLATRLPPQSSAGALAALHAADLYLVCACARHDRGALVAFEQRYVPAIDRALARLKIAPPAADDVKGRLRERLLFPQHNEQPMLAGYSGRGDLGRWVHSVTVRAALKARREGYGAPDDDAHELDVIMPGNDPELAYLKATFAAEFRAALAGAVAALDARERTLLRQHVLDGLTVDQLGKLYRVHRATAARRVADVRDRLLDGIRQRLKARLRLSEGELESALRLARSQLDVSIRRLLQPRRPGGPVARKPREGS